MHFTEIQVSFLRRYRRGFIDFQNCIFWYFLRVFRKNMFLITQVFTTSPFHDPIRRQITVKPF